MPPHKTITPLYQWTSVEPGPHNKDTEEEAIKPTKGIRDVSPHLEKEEDRNLIDPLTEIPHQEEHASSVGKWGTLPETAPGGRRRKASTSSTITNTTNRSTSHRPPCREIVWPR